MKWSPWGGERCDPRLCPEADANRDPWGKGQHWRAGEMRVKMRQNEGREEGDQFRALNSVIAQTD